ncbi:MAG: Polyribonucleotide nucleotidyltransferase [Thermotoga sp. 50_1627]|nr:MAG: Polyribonucleotide nucleotidyltransferase [Thermotoga sp. 50_64]KUK25904.1 MAG: Polyribonucleotide nucleotidyltransferase [Thermotoga sp. 50_1627]MDK2922802.1 polyribonucleotide nucleotidyltransferase [Pseudothermotoga sp.]HBT38565.1 polyribonucleotide nucleotidyltransferase [Pseudothermotoga sp.]HCO98078.1 polyribonucleotide nucleotidyltransferase [Pseudothermotoga sp.]
MKYWRRVILGREFYVEHGRVAKQANGAVLARVGDSTVLATAVMSDQAVEGIDFVPLTVEFQERFYAAGKIPGGFVKREGKPSETAILSARTIDRPIRPLFPKHLRNEVQVVVTVLSADPGNPPDVVGVMAASLALNLSDIPFNGVVAAVRVGLVDGQVVFFPSEEELERSSLDIVVAGTADAITMVEGEAKEVSEEQMVEVLFKAHDAIRQIVEFEQDILSEFNVTKAQIEEVKLPEDIEGDFRALVDTNELRNRLLTQGKKARAQAVGEYYESILEKLKQKYSEEILNQYAAQLKDLYEDLMKHRMRRIIVEEGIRLDLRGPKDIRPITCEIGLLPRVHGSALFTRGETQSLGIVTLGAPMDEQIVDTILEEGTKRFMLHYNFPPFCTGEVKPLRGPSRREIGHGHLAERALKFVLPGEDEFPYTIRVVSEILESNGSSSMATVCSGSLALMDAGVPVKKHVAGVAMGLILEPDAVVVLTDIMGAEDHWGDMDFKVAGTRDGITAFQMDCKVSGVSRELLYRALMQAKEARMFVLDKMYSTIDRPRSSLSSYAPVIKTTIIDPMKVGEVIGPGGRIIKGIIKEFDVQISVDDETGRVSVIGSSEEKVDAAIKRINEIVKEIAVGDVFEGKITRIEPFGVFLEVGAGKIGLLHQSKLLSNLKTLKIGDTLKVKVSNIDNLGRLQFEEVASGQSGERRSSQTRTERFRQDERRPTRSRRNPKSGSD